MIARKYLDPSAAPSVSGIEVARSWSFGGTHLLDSLWRELALDQFFSRALAERSFAQPVERAIFSLVCHRALAPGSKLGCSRWAGASAWIPRLDHGGEEIDVQHLYRAMDFLHAAMPELQEHLYFQVSDLLNADVSVLFYDTTSVSFYLDEADPAGGLRRYGHSKKKRPDLPQIVVALAINRDGIPIRHWIFPGNRSDVTTVEEVTRDLLGLRPRRFLFVDDRGMVSQANLDFLESRRLGYLLGCRLRADDALAARMLRLRGRYRTVRDGLEVKETTVTDGGRPMRYLLCRNEGRAKRDAATRAAILERLESELAQRSAGHRNEFMPTVGWIAEDATDRLAEARHRPLPLTPPRALLHCQVCGSSFRTSAAFAEHVSRAHPLELPALYVRGEPLLREHVLRTPLTGADVSMAPCTHCEVSVDGEPERRLSPAEFRERFVRASDGTWNVRLVHERAVDGSRAEARYHVRFRIPYPADLDLVDALFRQALVRDELRPRDLDDFQASLPDNAAAREYGAALGDYALGIMLKEQRAPQRTDVGLDEFASRMRSALETLCYFDRPVALAVCASIAFNLNLFLQGTRVETSVVELGAGFRFFRHVTSSGGTDASGAPAAPAPASAAPRPICPVDAVSHRLLAACGRIVGEGLTAQEIDALLALHTEYPVWDLDRVKIQVICAEGLLRLGRAEEATRLLRELQHTPIFREWARSHLSISSHDVSCA